MKFDRNILVFGTAAACAWLGSPGANAADSHIITVNATSSSKCIFNARSSTIGISIDPAATTTVTGTSNLVYRCTSGTTPSFTYASANSGQLVWPGTASFAYSYSNSGGGAGSGMGTAEAKTLTVTAAVDQTVTADKPAGTYSDTITVTVQP